ncbi:MAG TPA: hypothetical protein VFI31_13320 [Pirellulales bacterium]|nr:hypothetical protein [Pirellulales bacterium]
MTEVGKLNDEQTSRLAEEGRRVIDRLQQDLEIAVVRHVPVKAYYQYVRIQGKPLAVPPGFNRQVLTSPGAALRGELAKAIADAWPATGKEYDAEQARLNALRKRAGALAKVCEIDAILLLSGPQRSELCDQLMRHTSDDWWQAANERAPVNDPDEQLLASAARGSLCTFLLSAVEWKAFLRPVQLARYEELWGPRKEEIVFLQAAAGQPARIIRRGPKLADQVRCLTTHLEEWIAEVDAACQLTATQREKLLLAGKLDVQALESRQERLPEQVADGQRISFGEVSVPSGKPVIPLTVLTDGASFFQRALKGRLSAEQRRQWTAVEGERRAFQRKAAVAAVVAGFERVAALTSHECESLSAALNGSLAADDFGGPADWRLAYLRRLAQLPEQQLRPLFSECQWPSAREQYLQLAEMMQQYGWQQAQKADSTGSAGTKLLQHRGN